MTTTEGFTSPVNPDLGDEMVRDVGDHAREKAETPEAPQIRDAVVGPPDQGIPAEILAPVHDKLLEMIDNLDQIELFFAGLKSVSFQRAVTRIKNVIAAAVAPSLFTPED